MEFLSNYYLPAEIISIILDKMNCISVINLSSVNSKYKQCILQLLGIRNRIDKLEYIHSCSTPQHRKSYIHKLQLLKFCRSNKQSIVIPTSTPKLRFLIHKAVEVCGLQSEKVRLGVRERKLKTYIDINANCDCNPISCYHLKTKYYPEHIYGVRVYRS